MQSAEQAPAARARPGAPRRTVADALRLDWGRELRWAVPVDPWGRPARAEGGASDHGSRGQTATPLVGAVPALAAAASSARRMAGLPSDPAVLGLLEDAPLGGPLANLYTAAGAIALAREARLPAVLCLLPPAGGRPGPLYALGRDGEIRRIAFGAAALGEEARRACVELLGAAEAVAGRSWPLAHSALDAAVAAGWPGPPAAPPLSATWSLALWRTLLAPFGCNVIHTAAPPVAAGLTALADAMSPLGAVLAEDLRASLRRIEAQGLACDPDPPETAFAVRSGRGAPSRTAALLLLHLLVPAAATVAGDADAGRLVALAPVLERMAGARPAVRPRPRWTVVGTAEAAFARAHGAPLDQGPVALRLARDRAMLRGGAPRLRSGLGELRTAVEVRLAALGRAAADELPQSAGLLAERGQRLLRACERLAEELAVRCRAEDRAAGRAWRHFQNSLYPFDQDQDDWLAAYPWLAAPDGVRLIARLVEEPAGPARRWLRWPERAGEQSSAVAARKPAAAAGSRGAARPEEARGAGGVGARLVAATRHLG